MCTTLSSKKPSKRKYGYKVVCVDYSRTRTLPTSVHQNHVWHKGINNAVLRNRTIDEELSRINRIRKKDFSFCLIDSGFFHCYAYLYDAQLDASDDVTMDHSYKRIIKVRLLGYKFNGYQNAIGWQPHPQVVATKVRWNGKFIPKA